MRGPIRKRLVATFQREFEKKYPQFTLLKIDGGPAKVWGWKVAPRLVFFVLLQPFESDDIFALEIAWNKKAEFPWANFGDELRMDAPCWRDRLVMSWEAPGDAIVWDLAPEETKAMKKYLAAPVGSIEATARPETPAVDVVIPRVAPLVEDCLQKFHQYGLPVFKQVAEHRGLADVKWYIEP